jgi:branched-chain amino acid transport system permease protein
MAATALAAPRATPSPMMAAIRRAAGVGVIAGIALVYLAMVGLVGAFARRPFITGVGADAGPGILTLGLVMLLGVLLLAGLATTGHLLHRPVDALPRLKAVLAGVLAGAIAGAVLAGFLLVSGVVAETNIFLPVSQAMIDFLTFGQGVVAGGAIWVVLGALVAGAGGALYLLDARERGALLNGLAVTLLVSLLEPILSPILQQVDLDDVRRFLYSGGGLTQVAALVIFVGTVALSWVWRRPAAPLRERLATMPAERRRPVGMALAVLALLALLVLPQVSTGFVNQVLVNVGFFLMLALGLNIVVGYAGLLDLGYVAFYAVGAYTMAILTSPTSSLGGPALVLGVEWAFWLALPVVMIVAALIGIFIGAPVLRLRGDYLAIVTLGFGEIARFLFRSEALREAVGGPAGVVGLPNMYVPGVGELTSPGEYFYPVVAFAALAAYVAWRLSKSRTGRAWNAMREDETVAAATGINTTNYKLLAFALGGTLGGISGGLFAVQLRSVYPDSFLLIVSITALAIIILGGMGTIRGVIAGALILVGLPEALREFGEYRYLLYGAALVGMMVLRPEGLFPSRVRRAELHADVEREDDEQLAESDGDISTGQSATSDKPRAGERVE